MRVARRGAETGKEIRSEKIDMKPRTLLTLIAALAAMGARADLVTDWNSVALQAIRTDRMPPPKASRALAILHASIYDSVNGIRRTHQPYLVTGHVPASASEAADSRVYGGIHFRFASEDGLVGGLAIGEWTFTRYLKSKGNRARFR